MPKQQAAHTRFQTAEFTITCIAFHFCHLCVELSEFRVPKWDACDFHCRLPAMSIQVPKPGYSLRGEKQGGPNPPPVRITMNSDGKLIFKDIACWECYSKLCVGIKGTHACSFCSVACCVTHISNHLSHDEEDKRNAVHMWYCSRCMKKYFKYEIDLVEEVIDLTEAEE